MQNKAVYKVIPFIGPSVLIGIISFCFIFYVISKIIIHPRFNSPLRRIPGPNIGHWLWGQYGNILKSEVASLQLEWAAIHGQTVRAVGPLGLERLIVLSPAAVRKVLSSDSVHYDKPHFARELLRLTTGNGLLTATGSIHKIMRRQLGPLLAFPNVLAKHSSHYKHIDTLINALRCGIESAGSLQGVVFPLHDWLTRLSLDIITDVVIGHPADSLTTLENELIRGYHQLAKTQSGLNVTKFIAILGVPGVPKFLQSKLGRQILTNPWAQKVIPWTEPISETLEAMDRIKSVAWAILEQRTSEPANPEKHNGTNLLSLLIPVDAGMTSTPVNKSAIIDQILTFLGAGHETIAGALSWAVWCLANYPDTQEVLYDEISSLVAANAEPTHAELRGLPYLNGFVNESLRLYPPIPTTFRQATRDDWIDGYFIPKGTLIYIGIRAINMWKQNWGNDAAMFKPERWIDLDRKVDPYSYVPFLCGPRTCPGKAMAILTLKSTLVKLVYNFKFHHAIENQKAQTAVGITLVPKDGLPLRVQPRLPYKER